MKKVEIKLFFSLGQIQIKEFQKIKLFLFASFRFLLAGPAFHNYQVLGYCTMIINAPLRRYVVRHIVHEPVTTGYWPF